MSLQVSPLAKSDETAGSIASVLFCRRRVRLRWSGLQNGLALCFFAQQAVRCVQANGFHHVLRPLRAHLFLHDQALIGKVFGMAEIKQLSLFQPSAELVKFERLRSTWPLEDNLYARLDSGIT